MPLEDKKKVVCPTCHAQIEVTNPRGEKTRRTRCIMCGGEIIAVFHDKTNVNCPRCHTLLTVVNTHDEAIKQVKCIKCGHPFAVNFQMPTAGDTVISARSQQASGDTLLMGNAMPRAGWLECNGRRYDLQAGDNVVGRKATTSGATVQLDIDDMYVSREHLLIRVQGTVVTVTNHKNKNNTWVNGMQLANGDVVNLSDGVTIKVGDTKIVYKQH